MNGECDICGNPLNNGRFTISISDFKKHKAYIVGHDECTSEIMTKIKSYKNYNELSVAEIVKRLKLDVEIISFT